MTRHRNDGLRKRCGCSWRDWSKCSHPWYFSYQWKRHRYRISLDREVGQQLKGKTEATTAAETIKAAIRAGTFRQRVDPLAGAVEPPAALSLDAYADIFLERYAKARGKVSWTDDCAMLNQIRAFSMNGTRFGDKAIQAITEDDVETFMESLRTAGRAASTRNHYLQLFNALGNWGTRKGYLLRPWIGPLSDLKRDKVARRSRRLDVDEEKALFQAASPLLYRLMVAGIETGCRQGELLFLQWQDVNLERRELRIRAVNAKSREARYIPISNRLKAVLEMARHDPTGHEYQPEAYVFGDAVGRRARNPKKAWETAVLKAHGQTPRWTGNNSLTAESRIAYREIGLHFHDLRHEAGSRWLEAGMPLHHVRALLGHASISTTDTYLNAGRIDLQNSMRRLDELGKSGTHVTQGHGIESPLVRQPKLDDDGKSVLH